MTTKQSIEMRDAIRTATAGFDQRIVDAALSAMTDDDVRNLLACAMVEHLKTPAGKSVANDMLNGNGPSDAMRKFLAGRV